MHFNIHKITDQKWDYVIIGTGIGGSSFGLKMAKAGKKVLFLEKGILPTIKGQFAEQNSNFHSHQQKTLKNAGRCSVSLQDKSKKAVRNYIPFIGSGVGGSSQLYGMVFERFSESEFECSQNAWPFSYRIMQHYYQEAEQLFHVQPTAIQSQANKEVIHHLQNQGLKTYPLWMGKRPSEIECEGCQGLVCHCGKRADAYNSCLEQALEQYGAKLVTNCEVLKLNSDSKSVNSVSCCISTEEGNVEIEIIGSQFVLAAGALFTPVLLLKSKNEFFPNGLANSSGLVGKNLMRHLIDIYGLWTKKSPESKRDLKEFGAKHFYFDSEVHRSKGVLQSFGRLPAVPVLLHEMSEKIENPIVKGLFFLMKPLMGMILQFVRQRMLFVATILEDSPSIQNQVQVDEKGQIQIQYNVTSKDEVLLKAFRKNIQKYIGKFIQLKLLQAHENERIAHACGTCRMGKNSENSVVNSLGQTHDIKNLWIVDASIFPSSASINPSLTIAANALRSAEWALKVESQNELFQNKKVPFMHNIF